MECADAPRVQAYFDGQVDAPSAAAVEAHLAGCAECRALLADLEQTRALLRGLPLEGASRALRARLAAALDRETAASAPAAALRGAPVPPAAPASSATPAPPAPSAPPAAAARAARRPRPFWLGALGGGIGGALAAGLLFLMLTPAGGDRLQDEIVAAHLRSLLPAHLIDVESTDRHTVKPWFAGHADVSPVVADFASSGFRLVGGRVDYVEQQRAAVVVYQHGAHVINVFSWTPRGRAVTVHATRNGYRLALWQSGGVQYCAVTDTGWDELQGLVQLLQDQVAHEADKSRG